MLSRIPKLFTRKIVVANEIFTVLSNEKYINMLKVYDQDIQKKFIDIFNKKILNSVSSKIIFIDMSNILQMINNDHVRLHSIIDISFTNSDWIYRNCKDYSWDNDSLYVFTFGGGTCLSEYEKKTIGIMLSKLKEGKII